jgi:hypothetical protein
MSRGRWIVMVKDWTLSPQHQKQGKLSILTTSIWHCTGGIRQYNKTRERKKYCRLEKKKKNCHLFIYVENTKGSMKQLLNF